MSAISTLVPPTPPQVSPAANVMAFQMQRRSAASAAVDAVREAAREDPRAALRQAHADKLTATTEASRLSELLDRARQHRDVVKGRLGAAEAAVRHVESAAVEGLIGAFASNATPAIAVQDAEASKAARLSREVQIASNAVDRLGIELADAQEQGRIAGWRVRALALAALEAHAVKIAEEMLIEQQQMRRLRAQLGDLQLLLSNEGRAIYGDAINPPAAISAAVTAADPPGPWRPSSPYAPRAVEPPNPWSEAFRALLADPETALGEVSG